MLLRNMDHDVHIFQLLLLFCKLVVKMIDLLMELIDNRCVMRMACE